MGWGFGWSSEWGRDIGYIVLAYCDHPRCTAVIDRGLSFICAHEEVGGGDGCGLFFCDTHRHNNERRLGFCTRCANSRPPFDAKPDHPRWSYHKLHDWSWAEWRSENAKEVEAMRATLGDYSPPADDHDTSPTPTRSGDPMKREEQ